MGVWQLKILQSYICFLGYDCFLVNLQAVGLQPY